MYVGHTPFVGHTHFPVYIAVSLDGTHNGVYCMFMLYIIIINPRRACAARVTVVVLCVCQSVCLSVCLRLFSDYRLRGGL